MNNETLIKLFFRFLKENNCYKQFVNNYNNDRIFFEDYSYLRFKWIELFKRKNTPIDCFDWEDSCEGFDKWDELNEKWKYILFKLDIQIK